MVKGLELAEKYFQIFGLPMLQTGFSEYTGRVAAGLVGPGSECFGFDDTISRDHDWGPGFCIWLTEKDYAEIGSRLQKEYLGLPQSFEGYGPRKISRGEEERTGVSEITVFYRRYIGMNHIPQSLEEWILIPDQALAVCTNGKIFYDPLGEFSKWRERLVRFYPEDIRLKKIASRCMTIAQSGQYNYERSIKRKEFFAAQFAETQFCSDVISMIFLLNRKYCPFYKWAHRAVKELFVLGEPIHYRITDLIKASEYRQKIQIIEDISSLIIKELARQHLSESSSDFLLDHGRAVHRKIRDQKLRKEFSLIR